MAFTPYGTMAGDPYSIGSIYPPGSMAGRLRRDLEQVIADDGPYREVAGLGPRQVVSAQTDDLDVEMFDAPDVTATAAPVDADDLALDLSGLTVADKENIERIGGSVAEQQRYANDLRSYHEKAKLWRKGP
jgi:hypothetical protein